MSHARAAPSGLALTIACEGSLQLQELVPPCPPTDEEAEGTAAHVVAMAHGAALASAWIEGKKFENGGRQWTITKDMFEGAQMYARALGGPHGNLRLEDGVKVTALHASECWGTPDAWRYFAAGSYEPTPYDPYTTGFAVVRVGDYKFGHRYVNEFENPQLVAYALGVIERLNLIDTDVILELILVQPRCFSAEPVRVWRVRASVLRAFVNLIYGKVEVALGPNPPTTTGSHCLDCKARHMCKTLRYGSSHIVTYSGTAEPTPLDVVAMGQELRILVDASKQLEARLTGLKAQVEAHVRAGYAVPLWTLKPGRANRQWNDDVTPEYAADSMATLGINIRKPMQVMTPTQAIDAGLDEDIIMEYAHRPKPALLLKPDDKTEARKLFYGANRT
jgi:hypothetical protein